MKYNNLDTDEIDEGKRLKWFKLFGRPITKKRLINMYLLFVFRQGIGSGLIDAFRVQQFAIIGTFAKVFIPRITMVQIVTLGILFYIFTYLLGLWNEQRLKLIQAENELFAQHAKPYEQRIERRLMRIERKLKINMGEDKNVKHTGT